MNKTVNRMIPGKLEKVPLKKIIYYIRRSKFKLIQTLNSSVLTSFA